MRITTVLALAAFMAVAAAASANAGGTPDALNGARGRDRPTSFEGHRHYHWRYRHRLYRRGYGM